VAVVSNKGGNRIVTVGKSSAGKANDPISPTYARELTNAELAALALDVDRRMIAVQQQGAVLPLGSIENHLVIGLLERLLGEDEALTVREWHLTWLDRQLDNLEAQIRQATIANLDVLNGAVRP
jgi:hypothetical protein